MARRLQVFVSSTYLDLKEERQAAVEAILKAKHIPAGMELFAAGNDSQLEVIKRWIDESDVYMLILGHRYGSIEPKSGKSYTHVEFDYAVASGKPVFSVVMTDDWRDARVAKGEAKIILEQHDPTALIKFRALVMNDRMCKQAEDRKDIEIAVLQSLADFVHDKSLVGWVRGDSDDRRQELEKEVAGLKGELAAAQRQNTTLEKRLEKTKGGEEPDWAAAQSYLMNTKVNLLPLFREDYTASLSADDVQFYATASVLNLLLRFRSTLVVGVATWPPIQLNVILFYHVMPHLTTYGLTEPALKSGNEGVEKVRLSKRGNDFLVWLDCQGIKPSSEKA